MPNSFDLVHGSIITSPDDLPNDPPLDHSSFISLLSSDADIGNPEFLLPKQGQKPITCPRYPRLEHLLLKDIVFGKVEDSISILRPKLDFIYLWNCGFETDDLIWSVLCNSMNLINSMQTKLADGFNFTFRANEHTAQIPYNRASSFLMPDSLDLVHGLILPLGQNLPRDLLLNNTSLLALFSLETDFRHQKASSQFEQGLDFMLRHQGSNTKYLLLKDIDLYDRIEDTISLSQLKLDLI
jgi:hypothetical protein